jgi:ribosome-binding factor A
MSRSWKNKFLPNLHFVLDESFDYAEKIEKLIIKTHEND